MKIDEIRIYSEVLEQGIDFKEYFVAMGITVPIINIYTKKPRDGFSEEDSLVDRIRKVKDIDLLITIIDDDNEYPLLLTEYSTAVPTDDHKMQRSDVYYWSSVFKTPMMKISPVSKGMEQDFGGGSKFTDNLEISMACKIKAVLYHVHWKNETGKTTLEVKENALSCIDYSSELEKILDNLVKTFLSATSFEEYFEFLLKSYLRDNAEQIREYSNSKIKNLITNSTRFYWLDEKLRVKINRFGHAMDPERGVLYFANMLLGAENVVTEIQVNRSNEYNCRGGYSSLFDATSRKHVLERYVKELIRNGNVFTDENAVFIFKTALNIDDNLFFEKVSENNYRISDENLLTFLNTFPSISTKSIFFLSTELQLTDKNRNIICKVTWNVAPIKEFIDNIANFNFDITRIKPLSTVDAKEDIVTFASVELYKRIQSRLLAVSYPGAQGDRCVLTGSGRNVKRTYVDIIAYKDTTNGIKVYLEECKGKFTDSQNDVTKLKEFKTVEEKKVGLKRLFYKTVGIQDFSDLYISVAAKSNNTVPRFDVDYIFMFDIDSCEENITKINYTVAIIDLSLINDFSALQNNEGKLKGTLEIEKIYTIK